MSLILTTSLLFITNNLTKLCDKITFSHNIPILYLYEIINTKPDNSLYCHSFNIYTYKNGLFISNNNDKNKYTLDTFKYYSLKKELAATISLETVDKQAEPTVQFVMD